jgi:hypothetical protein
LIALGGSAQAACDPLMKDAYFISTYSVVQRITGLSSSLFGSEEETDWTKDAAGYIIRSRRKALVKRISLILLKRCPGFLSI